MRYMKGVLATISKYGKSKASRNHVTRFKSWVVISLYYQPMQNQLGCTSCEIT